MKQNYVTATYVFRRVLQKREINQMLAPPPPVQRSVCIGVYRSIGQYRHTKHQKSLTSLNMTRHLLCVYFRQRTAHCLCERNLGLEYRDSCHSGVLAIGFKDVIDFLCFERRWRPVGRCTNQLHPFASICIPSHMRSHYFRQMSQRIFTPSSNLLTVTACAILIGPFTAICLVPCHSHCQCIRHTASIDLLCTISVASGRGK